MGLVCQNLGYKKHPQLPGTYWTCNLEGIYANLGHIFDYESYGQYHGSDVLLILGGNSYKYDPQTFKAIFPELKEENVIVVKGAGHWVHSEKPEETIVAISDFLLELDSESVYGYSPVIYGK